jgi:alpha-tubulin suppressor-like RCC1 family protein
MPNDTDAPVWVVTDEFDNPRLAKVKSVSAGSEHTCAVANAEAWCWGENGSGQLGNRDKPNDQDVAVRVVKSTGDPFAQVTGVAASDTHSCAISAGSAWCWGKNDYGQLGNNDGTLAEQTGAVQVVKSDATPLKGVSALAIGYYHTCAIASGGVWCWGDNEYGQLGNGDAQIGINQIVAVEVLKADGTPLKGVKSIDAGIQQTCALASAQVWCWGKNDYGQLGNPDVVARTAIPTLVEKTGDVALTNVTAIGVSDEHGCAVSLAQAWCWGRNNHDQLGNNDALHANQSRAVLVLNADTTAFTSVTMLAAGKRHTCAQANKQLWCWGSNDYGQLGNGDAPTDQNGAVLVRYAYSLLR